MRRLLHALNPLRRIERLVINGRVNPTPLMTRYKLLLTRWGNLYLHVFHRSDEDRELHDHPWGFVSLILWGGYYEWLWSDVSDELPPNAQKKVWRPAGPWA